MIENNAVFRAFKKSMCKKKGMFSFFLQKNRGYGSKTKQPLIGE